MDANSNSRYITRGSLQRIMHNNSDACSTATTHNNNSIKSTMEEASSKQVITQHRGYTDNNNYKFNKTSESSAVFLSDESNDVDHQGILNLSDEEMTGLCTPQWDQLPLEILTKIFSYLTICDTDTAENTCVAWKRACNAPFLWRRAVFNFDGSDSLQLMAEAFRQLSSKGHHTRDLVLSIGSPGLNQAWMMSGCIQQLLDFICQSPCQSIESIRISNLVIFTQNRFFKLSKESILTTLIKFLRSQKNLTSISFTHCRFNPADGLKILRVLKRFRPTLKHLELHEFFKRKYVTATKAFKIISTLTFLEDLRVDADYFNDRILMWLVEKWPHRKPLRHVKLYFEAMTPPPVTISGERWTAVRKCFQDLTVSFHIGGFLCYQWMDSFITEAIPLVECTIYWNFCRRQYMYRYADHLTRLIGLLAKKQSSLLERFTLFSDVTSSPELEDALLLLISSCARLAEVNIEVSLLSPYVTDAMAAILRGRNRPITFNFRSPTPTWNSARRRRARARIMRDRGR